jgi:hypothetical protein
MGATNSFESEIVRHILLNEAIPDIGNAGGLPASSVDGNIYIALFTQNPGEAGDITNEATYTGYARVAVARGSGWTESEGNAQNVAAITFPECTGGSEDLTYFGICKTLAGDDMIFHGELPSPFPISQGMQPQYDIGQLAINFD